jgi:conjugal transfer pilin signal peptidase TrbI
MSSETRHSNHNALRRATHHKNAHPAGFAQTVLADSGFDSDFLWAPGANRASNIGSKVDAHPGASPGADFADTLVLQDLPEAGFLRPAPRRDLSMRRSTTSTPPSLTERIGEHLRRHGWAYCFGVPVFAVWMLAYVRVFVDPTPRLPLVFNWTSSLPYRVAWLHRDVGIKGTDGTFRELRRGDQVVYAFDGDALQAYPGLKGQPFYKVIRGLPGDEVSVEGRTVFINGEPVGIAKTHTFDKRALRPIAPMGIPPGHYFVQGTATDSFDSRYSASGLIKAQQLLGRVTPLF